MSAENKEVANRATIVAAKRITLKGLPWIPDIVHLHVLILFLYPAGRDQGRENPGAKGGASGRDSGDDEHPEHPDAPNAASGK